MAFHLGDLFALAGGLIWIILVGALFRRLKKRRSHIGAGAVGSVYEMLNEDKRKAVELIVEEKTGERDPERATGKPKTGSSGPWRREP